VRFLGKAQERKERFERIFSIRGWRKALKGKPKERGELKEASGDMRADAIERVAKP
jgi:hypothetical protein